MDFQSAGRPSSPAAITTLAIDFGSKNIGIALVQTAGGVNKPLFAGTALYERYLFKKGVKDRVALRRIRRTRKSKRQRLHRLQVGLSSLGLDPTQIAPLVNFCRRRGYKSLFDDDIEAEEKETGEETVFRYSRENFFAALEAEVGACIPEGKRGTVIGLCERVLNRAGDRYQEIRPLRIENRGVSRCAWDGCDRVTPRRENDLRAPVAQFVYTVYASHLRDNDALRADVDSMLDKLGELGKRYRHAGGPDPTKSRKVLTKKINETLKVIAGLGEEEAWEKNRKNIRNLLLESSGRNRYCKDHSQEYLAYLIEGRPIPFKKSLSERDITSRVEEILFQKLWRYIEARVLPLCTRVDRIVVERSAFNLLAGSFNERQKISDDKLEELYQNGPRIGFDSTIDMLKKEFGGLCAYCGNPGDGVVECDHILPRAEFFFDSYLNLVPACPSCNRTRKSKATPAGAGLTIHPVAYEAYSRYIKTKHPPHLLHTIKNGLLKRMTFTDSVLEAEAYLGMIARNFAETTQTQRAPRPLARYLWKKLQQKFGTTPEIVAFRSGRHTDIWRRAAYPDFDKVREKEEGGVLNHALDALLLGCELPDIFHLEAKNLRPMDLAGWRHQVEKACPPPGPYGIPVIPAPRAFVEGFEELFPNNFIKADLGRMNWNRKDSAIQRQGIYGWNKGEDAPVIRKAASMIAGELRDADKKPSPGDRQKEVKKIIEIIVHPHLRRVLEEVTAADSPGASAATALTDWLQKTIRGSIQKSKFSPHPADQNRRSLLWEFASGQSDTIPIVIGIQTLCKDHQTQIDLNRVDKSGNIIHRYYADPANRAYIVAFKGDGKQVKRHQPLSSEWRQDGRIVAPQRLGRVDSDPLKGCCIGQRGPSPGVWEKALCNCFQNANIVEYNVVQQGCVICYDDGSEKFVRNFAPAYGFRRSLFKNMIAVKRSPLGVKITGNRKIA